MTNLISKCLVLFEIDEKVLFVVLEVVSFDFCDVLFDIWERISDVFLTPGSGIEEDVDDRLLFDKHLVGFVSDSLGDCRGLSVVDTMWWGLPIILNGRPVRVSDEYAARVSGLHRVSQKSCHVEVPRHLENMAKVLSRSCRHSKRHISLGNLLEHVFKNILNVIQ